MTSGVTEWFLTKKVTTASSIGMATRYGWTSLVGNGRKMQRETKLNMIWLVIASMNNKTSLCLRKSVRKVTKPFQAQKPNKKRLISSPINSGLLIINNS
jgi:hypothetical protein